MKLHLPVKLLRAVMALFVIHGAIAASWAQEATPPYTIDKDVTYVIGEEPWVGTKPEWGWENDSFVLKGGVDLIFTSSSPEPTYSLVFKGKEGAFNSDSKAAVVGNIVTIENLKNVQFTGFDGNSYAVYTPELTIQNNTNVSVDKNTGDTNIYSGIVTLSGNDSIDMSQNAVNHKYRLENGEIVKKSSPVRGGVIYGGSGQWFDDYGVYVLGNGLVTFSGNNIVADCWEAYGGVIYTDGQVSLKENTNVSFNGNRAESNYVDEYEGSYSTSTQHSYAYGGAIYSDYSMYEYIEDNVILKDEEEQNGISICNNGQVAFSNNTVVGSMGASGGAIFNNSSKTLLSDNGSLTFMLNKAEAKRDGGVAGGAIYSGSSLTITGNGDILFDKNTISTNGGLAFGSVIAVEEGSVLIEGNKGTITVSDNGVTGSGEMAAGAVMSMTTLDISSNVGKITFSGNYINDVEGTSGYFQLVAGAAVTAFGSVNIASNQNGIVFDHNTIETQRASAFGGAIVNLIGDVTFSGNEGAIQFVNNTISGTSSARGGAIAAYTELTKNLEVEYSGEKSSVVFKNNGAVLFSGNKLSSGYVSLGGAIYSSNEVILSENAGVSFVDNGITTPYHAAGGAIFSKGNIAIEDNTDDVLFEGNTIDAKQFADGGALYVYYGQDGNVLINRNNGDVAFIDNRVSSETQDASGGAIYCRQDIQITENKNVSFEGNSVITNNDAAQGGAISCGGNLTISDNADILFDNNTISSVGGAGAASAIALDGVLIINDNKGTITVSNNGATTYGSYYGNDGNHYYGGYATVGAVCAASTQIVGNTGTVTFSGNYIKDLVGPQNNPFDFKGYSDRIITGDPSVNGIAGGAALVSLTGTNISNNGSDIKFSGNSIDAVNRIVLGGALANAMGDAKISDNTGTVEFSNNTAKASGTGCDVRGGAIATLGDLMGQIDPETGVVESSVKLQGNGGVLFSGNTATSLSGEAKGGGIYSSNDVIISDNKGDVSFSGNGVSGAIAQGGAIYANRDLSIVNNGDVTFQGNYTKNGDTYQLNSVYVVDGGNVELSAAAGSSISFYDSITVKSGSEVKLNSYTYTDAEGKTHTSTGSIVFSGATTEDDLKTAKNGVAGTKEEIDASRTSVIERNVSVAAGSLEVVDGAQLEMLSLTVDAGATLVLGAGSGITTTQAVTFSEGSHLTVQAAAEASTFALDEASVPTASITAGSVTLSAGMTYTMHGAYADLGGASLNLDVSGGTALTFNLDESVAIERNGKLYYVLFTGAKELTGTDVSSVEYKHNLANRENVALAYHEGSGTLYISATAPIPEPTTATLSLLALAGLAARRRRK